MVSFFTGKANKVISGLSHFCSAKHLPPMGHPDPPSQT